MFRTIAICVFLALLVTGCNQSPPSSFAKYNLHGGRYSVEIENTGGGTSLKFSSSSEGMIVTEELYELSWGNSHRLEIDNGKLTVDAVDLGELKPGDQIVVKSSGEIFINGTKQ